MGHLLNERLQTTEQMPFHIQLRQRSAIKTDLVVEGVQVVFLTFDS